MRKGIILAGGAAVPVDFRSIRITFDDSVIHYGELLDIFIATGDRLFDVPAGAAWAWVACFLGVDFLYYWFHRCSHEIRWMWATHNVHHSAERIHLGMLNSEC